MDFRRQPTALFVSLGVEKTYVANENFLKIIDISAERMVREYRTSAEDLEEAKRAFSTFMRKTNEFRETRAGRKGLILYQALSESKSSICPLWPIC
jgi:hypothetical protein